MKARALLVDDESLIRWSLRETLVARGFEVVEAGDGQEARKALKDATFDLVLLDHRLPDTTGLELLGEIVTEPTHPVVIMMTAYGTVENAVEAMKLGAYDYLLKPFEVEHVSMTVDRAMAHTRLQREVRLLRSQLDRTGTTPGRLIGRSEPFLTVLESIRRVAETDRATVLLRGETGTGKDVVARELHELSNRKDQAFVNVTCTALSETLLESELFGHERGAFTDARERKQGLFELADQGTVFLDEIGDMPANLQAKLLRFLEDRCFRRVGGTQEVHVDVRIIAATNRDLEQAIEDGSFRADLYYRLNVIQIQIPALRDRTDDIPLLAQHFAEQFSTEFKRPLPTLSDAVVAQLRQHRWPGNVRELRNAIERMVLLDEVAPQAGVQHGAAPSNGHSKAPPAPAPTEAMTLADLDRLEADMLQRALKETGGNQVQAADLLGTTRDRFRYRLKKHGIGG